MTNLPKAEEARLEAIVDGKTPFDLGCVSKGGGWFVHPTEDGLACKYGPDRNGRMLRVWCYVDLKEPDTAYVLDAERPSADELRQVAVAQADA